MANFDIWETLKLSIEEQMVDVKSTITTPDFLSLMQATQEPFPQDQAPLQGLDPGEPFDTSQLGVDNSPAGEPLSLGGIEKGITGGEEITSKIRALGQLLAGGADIATSTPKELGTGLAGGPGSAARVSARGAEVTNALALGLPELFGASMQRDVPIEGRGKLKAAGTIASFVLAPKAVAAIGGKALGVVGNMLTYMGVSATRGATGELIAGGDVRDALSTAGTEAAKTGAFVATANAALYGAAKLDAFLSPKFRAASDKIAARISANRTWKDVDKLGERMGFPKGMRSTMRKKWGNGAGNDRFVSAIRTKININNEVLKSRGPLKALPAPKFESEVLGKGLPFQGRRGGSSPFSPKLPPKKDIAEAILKVQKLPESPAKATMLGLLAAQGGLDLPSMSQKELTAGLSALKEAGISTENIPTATPPPSTPGKTRRIKLERITEDPVKYRVVVPGHEDQGNIILGHVDTSGRDISEMDPRFVRREAKKILEGVREFNHTTGRMEWRVGPTKDLGEWRGIPVDSTDNRTFEEAKGHQDLETLRRTEKFAKEDQLAASKTAISRGQKVSVPTKELIEKDLITGSVLHHGSGKAQADTGAMLQAGADSVDEFDPTFAPDRAVLVKPHDTVVSNFVLNVLPPDSRASAISDIAGAMAPGGKAIITVRGQGSGIKGAPSEDGFISSKGTFQKPYTPDSLKVDLGKAFENVEIIKGTDKSANITAIAANPKIPPSKPPTKKTGPKLPIKKPKAVEKRREPPVSKQKAIAAPTPAPKQKALPVPKPAPSPVIPLPTTAKSPTIALPTGGKLPKHKPTRTLPFREVKPTVRRTTGQVDLSETLEITEKKILDIAMKQQTKGARRGFSAGKKTGISGEKARANRIKAREALRKEMKGIINKIDALVKDTGIDRSFRGKIQELANKGLVSLSEGRRIAGEASKAIEAGEPAPVLDSFRQLLTQAEKMAKQGKLLKKTRRLARESVALRRANNTVDAIDRGSKLPPPDAPPPPASSEFPGTVDKVKSHLKAHRTAEAEAEALDGLDPETGRLRELGVTHQEVFQPGADANGEGMDMEDDLSTKLDEIAKPIRKDMIDIVSKKHDIGGKKITKSDAMGIYGHSQNEDNLRSLKRGNGYSNKQIDNALALTSDVEKKVVDDTIELFESLRPSVRSAYERAHPDDFFVQVAGRYFPKQTLRNASTIPLREQADQDLFANEKQSIGIQDRFTKERFPDAHEAVQTDFFDIATRHIKEVSHFVTHVNPVKQIQKLISDPKVVEAMTRSRGPKTHGVFLGWLDHIANPNVLGRDSFEEWVRDLRRNVTRSAIGSRITTTLLQPQSATLAARRAGVVNVAGDMVRAIAKAGETKAWVDSKSAFMRHRTRGFDPDVVIKTGIARGKLARLKVAKRKMDTLFMYTLGLFDYVGAYPSWTASYKQSIRQGKSELFAVRRADSVVRQTQPTSNETALSEIQRGGKKRNELIKALTMFYSFLSRAANEFGQIGIAQKLAGRAGGFKGAALQLPESLRGFLLAVVIPAIMGEATRKSVKRDVEGLKELVSPIGATKAIAKYMSGFMPVSRLLFSAMSRFSFEASPLEGPFKDLGRAAAAFRAKERKAKNVVRPLIRFGARTTGFPQQALDAAEAIDDAYITGPAPQGRVRKEAKAGKKRKK